MYKPIKKYKQGGIKVDPLGYYNKSNLGKKVIIPNNHITMDGLDFPVVGTDNLGNTKLMKPNQDYIFEGTHVLEQPLMQQGGNLTPPTLKQISQIGLDPNFKPLSYISSNNSDNTRIPIPTGKLTKEELAKNDLINKQNIEKDKNYTERLKNQRDINRASSGDFSGKRPFHIEDNLRLFPDSYGGWGEVFDDNINPAFLVGKMASNLGNGINKSIDQKSFKPLIAPIAEPLALGAMGFDPGGSLLKQAPNVINQTYKINPWAFKPDPNNLYRQIGESGYKDVIENNIIRSTDNFPKPYFAEGDVFHNYEHFSPGKNKYMVEMPMLKNEEFTAYPTREGGKEWISTKANIPLSDVEIYKNDWLQGYKKIPVENKPIFSQPEIIREPINYYDMPGFKERNPKITDWENYKGDVKLRNTVELKDELKPFIKMQTGGGFQPIQKIKPLTYTKNTSDYVDDFDRKVEANTIQGNTQDVFTDMPKPAPTMDLSTPKNIGDSMESFQADPAKWAKDHPLDLKNNQINNGKSILGNYPSDPYTKIKENIQKNEDFSYIPSLVNGVLGSIGNSMERNRQDEYTRNNLANPFNYLPMNNNTNNYVNKGVQMAEEGGLIDNTDDENDDMNWDFNEEEQEQEQSQQVDDSPYLAEQLASQQDIQDEPIFIPEEDDMSNSTSVPNSSTTVNPNINAVEEVNTNKHLSAAVRNNNPGNLKYSQFTKELGAKKGDMAADGDSSHHAYFDTVEQGLAALKKLITSGGYKNLPVEKALNRWITGSSNKQGVYSEKVGKLLNNKTVKDLNESELNVLVSNIIKNEDVNMAKKLGL